jgi:hypothetical protein
MRTIVLLVLLAACSADEPKHYPPIMPSSTGSNGSDDNGNVPGAHMNTGEASGMGSGPGVGSIGSGAGFGTSQGSHPGPADAGPGDASDGG